MFKVGDYVIPRASGRMTNWFKGEFGVVTEINYARMMVRVETFGGKEHTINMQDLKLFKRGDIIPPVIPKESTTCTCELRVVVNFGCNCEAGKTELKNERAS